MSLEAALAANTAAIEKLIELLDVSKSVEALVAQAEVAPSNTASDQPATGVPHAPSPQVEVAVSKPEEPSSPPAADVTQITYQDALKAITQLANEKGRQAAVDVLSQFGLKKLTEAKPEQYQAIIEATR